MIEHSDLTTKVYQWLKGRIMHHAFLPGDKLDIQQLADDLGVSRTPVKDAINRLTSEGLVVLRSRRGTYVATLTPAALRDLFETRTMIECWAAEHATREAMLAAAPAMQALFDRSTTIIAEADAAHFDYSAYFALDLDLTHDPRRPDRQCGAARSPSRHHGADERGAHLLSRRGRSAPPLARRARRACGDRQRIRRTAMSSALARCGARPYHCLDGSHRLAPRTTYAGRKACRREKSVGVASLRRVA